ncbi:MAG: DUF4410 domain-containing protein [Planctomycetota bacterium]|jgi:hypothetical protein
MSIYDLRIHAVLVVLIAAFITISCASSEVTQRQSYVGNEQLPKPGRVIVYNFATTPEDIPADAAISRHYESYDTPQTAEQIQLGRQLSDIVARELVKEILDLGLPAERATIGSSPDIGDLLIKGEIISIDEGSRMKRMLIGFGAGAGELKTHVEGYQITAQGPRRLGSGEVKTGGGKMPGVLVPVAGGAKAGSIAVSGGMNIAQEKGPESLEGAAKRTAKEIAKALSNAFARHGWIPASMAK